MNQRKIAKQSKISPAFLCQIVNGVRRPSWNTAKKLSAITRSKPELWLDGTSDEIKCFIQKLKTKDLPVPEKEGEMKKCTTAFEIKEGEKPKMVWCGETNTQITIDDEGLFRLTISHKPRITELGEFTTIEFSISDETFEKMYEYKKKLRKKACRLG